MASTWSTRLGVLLAAVTLVAGLGPAAWAAGGQSTPGVTVTAQNPGVPGRPSALLLRLTAHSEKSTAPGPDCRPATEHRPPPTLRCWGSLYLHAPSGLTVTGFQEVHKVSVGETSCGDDESGGCTGDEVGETAAPAASPTGFESEVAQVNGLAVVTEPGDGMAAGTVVQVHITLYDNSRALYQDQVLVQVQPKTSGQETGAYESGLLTIQQVQIHEENA